MKLTPAQQRRILRDYAAGVPIKAIAKRLGCARTTIQRLLHREGVTVRPGPRPSIVGDMRLAKSLIRLLGYAGAAERLGVTRQALYLRFPARGS